MPLQPCPECRTEISTEAAACPKCGYRRQQPLPLIDRIIIWIGNLALWGAFGLLALLAILAFAIVVFAIL